MNYFELDHLFAVPLKLMTYQSYAQVTISCNTVESPMFTYQNISFLYFRFFGFNLGLSI